MRLWPFYRRKTFGELLGEAHEEMEPFFDRIVEDRARRRRSVDASAPFSTAIIYLRNADEKAI